MIDNRMTRLLVLFSATAGLAAAQIVQLSVSPYPLSYCSQQVVLTATVAATSQNNIASFVPGSLPSPKGTVTFLDGTVPIGIVSQSISGLTNSVPSETFTFAWTPTGPSALTAHQLVASYAPSPGLPYTTAQSPQVPPITQFVLPPTVSAFTLVSPSTPPSPLSPPFVVGEVVALSATVFPALPNTTVAFYDNGRPIGGVASGGVPIDGAGTAISPAFPITGGTHTYYAIVNFPCGQLLSPPIQINGSGIPTTITLTGGPSPSYGCQQVTLTATVTPQANNATNQLVPILQPPGSVGPSLTGSVTFTDSFNGQVLTYQPTSVQSVGGALIATLQTTTLAIGNHLLTASYSGDANYAPSVSTPPIAQTVLAPTMSPLTVSPAGPYTAGQVISFSATVLPIVPGTVVTFSVDGVALSPSVPVDSSGNATYSGYIIPPGPHTLSAAATEYCTPLKQSTPITGAKIPPTVTVTVPASSIVCQPVTLTATVAVPVSGPVPTGTAASVTFQDSDGKTYAATTFQSDSSKLTATATVQVSTLTVGNHAFTATYTGDSNYLASTSPASATLTVTAPVLTLSPPPATIQYGTAINLTATIPLAAFPGASVTITFFLDGKALPNPVPTITGTAAYAVPNVPVGTHKLSATSTWVCGALPTVFSNTVTVVVTPLPTTTSLSANQSNCQPVFLTATVAPAVAGGTVIFFDITAGRQALGDSVVTNGTATLSAPPLTAGPHQFEADYSSDDGNYTPSSAATSLTTNPIVTTTSLAVQPTTSAPFQQVKLTATVTFCNAGDPAIPLTGTVIFTDSFNGTRTQIGGKVTLIGGTAPQSTNMLLPGGHSLTATYSGDTNYLGSTSSAVLETVDKFGTGTALSNSPTPSTFGQTVTLTATVTAPNATGGATPSMTGSVTFMDGPTTIGNPSVDSGGNASLPIATLSPGNHSFTASYSGDASYSTSTSTPAVQQTVTQATTSVTLSAPSSAIAGQTITLTATVTAQTSGVPGPSGMVTFKDGGTALGSPQPLSGGTASTPAVLSAGSHTITASYSGDTNYLAKDSASAPIDVPVLKISSPAPNISPPTSLQDATLNSGYTQPFTATGGTGNYSWSLAPPSPPGLMLDPKTGILSGTPTVAGVFDLTVQVQDSPTATPITGRYSLKVNYPDLPTVFLSVDNPQPALLTDTPTVTLTLSQSYPVDLTGTVSLSLMADAKVAGNPSTSPDLNFSGGSPSMTVTIPAKSTVFILPKIQIGSTAGIISAALTDLKLMGGTPAGIQAPVFAAPPPAKVTFVPMVPVISSAQKQIPSVTASNTSFELVITGTSNTRELKTAQVVFTAAPGKQLNNGATTFTPPPLDVSGKAATYFTNQGSTVGGTFMLTLTFDYSGDTSAIGSATIALTNSVPGSSATVPVQ